MKNNLLGILLLVTNFSFGQSVVNGTLKHQVGQEIKLLGYNGFKTITLAMTKIDNSGNFTLSYPNNYKGMGYLQTQDNASLVLVLNEPQIILKGTALEKHDSINFVKSKENKLFIKYATEHTHRENALAGWKYILSLYQTSSLFSKQNKKLKLIRQEINRIEKQDACFLKNIDKSTYVAWFLPLRKLIDDMPLSAQRYTNRIANNIADFRQINFNDKRLYHSGILDDLIKGHYWLLENSGMPMDSIYEQMNISTNYLIANLVENDSLLNNVTGFLFNLLEKRSLFKASEYLSLKMLTQNSCTLNNDLAKQLETYRIMKIGNTAKDILFTGKKLLKGMEIPVNLRLSTMNNKYTLVVFGASWCPKCAKEIPTITNYYQKWKSKGLEVVFISLDTENEKFTEFVKNFPFLSSCDFKSWKSPTVKDYYVFSTPTLFLLDKDRKILLRPSSIKQVDAWVKYKLTINNKKL